MKELHIVTVGISVLTHFMRANNLKLPETLKRVPAVAKFLAEAPQERCAEINSLNARLKLLPKPPQGLAVALVYSQTAEGRMAAGLIERFLRHLGVAVTKLQLASIDLPGLAGADAAVAQQLAERGLSKLRGKVTEHVAKMRRQHAGLVIQFNATGGFKAETAVLYELGRALRIPVYYFHETYKVAITLP